MSGRVLYEFNTKNNTKSWNINAYTISSISGDDLILKAGNNGNLKIEGNIIPSLSENYDLGDSNNKLRYIYANQINADVSGNASTCTKLEESIKIGGVDFTGENGINLPGVNITGNQNTTGNARTSSRLRKSILVGGVSFDGSDDISLAGVNMRGNQDTTGNAATATRLKNNIKIGGIPFDGTRDIDLLGVNTTGNAATATRLKNNIKIGGIPFDGTRSIDLPGVNTTGKVGTYGIALNAIGLYYKPRIGGVLFDGSSNIDLPGVNMAGSQDTSGKANSARKADALINDNSYANIRLHDSVINYVGTSHNFDGSLNNTQITNLERRVRDLTNELVLLRQGLNMALTQLGFSTI